MIVDNTSRRKHSEATNVAKFCRNTLRFCREELSRRQVHFELDVDAELVVTLPHDIVEPALRWVLVDACDHTPKGETLDISVLQTSDSVEIEIADARQTVGQSLRETHDTFMRSPFVMRALSVGISVETHVCPQGGLARTLVIPLVDEERDRTRYAA